MPVNETTLESFVDNNINILDELIGTEASQLTNLLSTGAITGMKESEILALIETQTASQAATSAMVNTRLNTYSRVATNTMMKDAPSDTKYVYVGPVDDRTRDECLERIADSPATKELIISKYGSLDNAGWNCRHSWEEQMSDVEAQGLQKETTNA